MPAIGKRNIEPAKCLIKLLLQQFKFLQGLLCDIVIWGIKFDVMKNLMLIIIFSAFIVVSCEKESVATTETAIESELKLTKHGINQKTSPGELFYGDGWVGWINPELYESDENPPEIFLEDAAYKGEMKTILVGDQTITMITCPTRGKNCGKVYYMKDQSTVPEYIGLYLIMD